MPRLNGQVAVDRYPIAAGLSEPLVHLRSPAQPIGHPDAPGEVPGMALLGKRVKLGRLVIREGRVVSRFGGGSEQLQRRQGVRDADLFAAICRTVDPGVFGSLHLPIEWDGVNLKAKNCPAADQYIRSEYRKGWDV